MEIEVTSVTSYGVSKSFVNIKVVISLESITSNFIGVLRCAAKDLRSGEPGRGSEMAE